MFSVNTFQILTLSLCKKYQAKKIKATLLRAEPQHLLQKLEFNF